MSDKKSNEALDTLQFKVPKVPSSGADKTKVYKLNDINNAQRRPSSSAGKTASQRKPQPAEKKSPSADAAHTSPGRSNPPRRTSEIPASDPRYRQKAASPASAPVKTASAKKKKKKGNPALKILRTVIIILLVLFAVYSGACYSYTGKLSEIEDTDRYVNDENNMLYSSEVYNILVIGTDARDSETRGLSDAMILLSLNKKNHKIQMTSFMRDMYLPIEEYGYDKLNAAYSYGGAPLLKNTVEDNFLIRIDACMTVNFHSVVYAVDAVGGVDIELSDSEAHAINDILFSEVNEIMGDDPEDDFLPGEGTYRLNGKQALSYSRIRYVGDADFERTQRQRTVITKIISGLKHSNPVTLNKYINKALPYIGTDMDRKQLFSLCMRAPSLLIGYKPEQLRVPCPDSWSYSETEDGMSIIEVDRQMNVDMLKEEIYLAD